jgi:hypothetical protein
MRTYPKKDPTGVLTAETMYTGGKDDIMAIYEVKRRELKQRVGYTEQQKMC